MSRHSRLPTWRSIACANAGTGAKITQTLDPILTAYFRDVAQSSTMLDLLTQREEIQKRATEELGRRFQEFDINCVAVLIGRPVLWGLAVGFGAWQAWVMRPWIERCSSPVRRDSRATRPARSSRRRSRETNVGSIATGAAKTHEDF